MRIFSSIFWAIILIVIGIIVILNQAFGWNISVFAIVIGVVLIFLGISIISGPSHTNSNGVFLGGSQKSVNSGDNNYFFSSVSISLDDLAYDKEIEINSIFSSVDLDTQGKSVKIKSSGAFSNTVFPDSSSLTFGDRVYERDGENTIEIETNCVFGSIVIR